MVMVEMAEIICSHDTAIQWDINNNTDTILLVLPMISLLKVGGTEKLGVSMMSTVNRARTSPCGRLSEGAGVGIESGSARGRERSDGVMVGGGGRLGECRG